MSNIKKNVFKIASGSLISQLILFAFTPVLSRAFEPDVLGTYALFTTLYSILAGISTLRYELSIPSPKSGKKAWGLTAVTISSSLFFSLCILLLMLFLLFLCNVNFPPSFLFIPVGIIILSFQIICLQWSARRKNYTRYSIALSINSFSNIGLVLILLCLGFKSVDVLIYGFISGIICSTMFLLSEPDFRFRQFIKNMSLFSTPRYILRTIKLNIEYPKYMLPTFLLASAATSAPVLIIGMFKSHADVGFYSLASRFLMVPGVIIGGAISEAVRAELFSRFHKKTELYSIVRRILLWGGGACILFMLVIALVGDKIFIFILGEKFVPAANIIIPLSLATCFALLIQPLQALFIVLNRQRLNLIAQVMMACIPSAMMVGVALAGSALNEMIWGYSVAYAIVSLFIIIILRNIGKRYERSLRKANENYDK